MILITHDRSLIELVADRLWLAADGHVKPFKGDMDDYARFVLDRAKNGIRAPGQIVEAAPPAKKKKQKAFAWLPRSSPPTGPASAGPTTGSGGDPELEDWIPACAGMSGARLLSCRPRR